MTAAAPGRVALVTGVGRVGQLGEVVARTFVDAGWDVALVAHAAADATARAGALARPGRWIGGFAADVGEHAAVARLVDAVLAARSRIDAVVHVAGGFAMSGPVADSDPAVWEAQWRLNAGTAYAVARGTIPALRATHGSFVAIASVAALPGAKVAGMSAYAAAKQAVATLVRAVAQEERVNGVRANAIAPGSIRTPANLATMPAATRYVEPADVARVAEWLSSSASAPVTGQIIEVSG